MFFSFSLQTLPRRIYDAFIKDGIRLYAVLPRNLRFSFWVIFVLLFVTAFVETLTLLVISLFAMSVGAPEASANHVLVKPFMAIFPPLAGYCADPRNMIIFASCLMVGFVGLKNLLSTFAMHKTGRFSENVSLYIGWEAFSRYLHKSYLWHISPASQTVIHKLNNRAQLSGFLVNLLQLYSNVVCCAALFTSLSLAEPFLTLVVVTCFASASLFTYMMLRRRIDKAGQLVNSAGIEASISMGGIMHGIREILIYRRQDVFLRNTMAAVSKGLPGRSFLAFSHSMPSHFLEFIGFSTVAGMVVGMLLMGMPMPNIIKASSILMLTAWRVLPAVNRSLSFAVSIRGQRPAALNCLDLLEGFIAEEPEELPEPDPDFCFKENISLENVSFRYPGAPRDALCGFSLYIAKGESIGLIGLSGAGKSTLALLLTGLVSPASGRFLVDGRPLSPAAMAAYVRQVGYVPQNPLLVGGTVADNVAFSQWGEPYDREAVMEACRMAAMGFVVNHPNGINMPLAANGAGLSGGQAQRVSIARALFTKPDLIIFDEATSALDQASENVIASTIKHLRGKATSIIIAHRLTTVENCDRLVWLEEGRVKAEGPPSEVLPLYQEAMAPK